jgi:hypothetical protein
MTLKLTFSLLVALLLTSVFFSGPVVILDQYEVQFPAAVYLWWASLTFLATTYFGWRILTRAERYW